MKLSARSEDAPRGAGAMRMCSVTCVVVCLVLLLGCGDRTSVETSRADLVVVGNVHTMNASAPRAEAIAIAGGRLVFVGDAGRARALLRPDGRTVELAPGQIVLPGLVDSHVHMLEAGVLQLGCVVEGPKTPAALFAAIKECAANNTGARAEWLVGSGWPAELFGELGPLKEDLDKFLPTRPAVFYGEDGHSAWLNSEALRTAKIDAKTEDPKLGRIERKPGSREPSGTLREAAVDRLIEPHVLPPTPEQYQSGLEIAQRHLHGFGITLVQDANVSESVLEAYHAAAASGLLTMKVVAAQATDPLKSAEQVGELIKRRQQYSHGRLTASSAKIFLDGVMEARTAALLQPYATKNDRGDPNWTAKDLAEITTRLDAEGFQIHMHGIGDRAIREGLDALEKARVANGATDLRHQIAHLQLVDPADIRRLAPLGVFANFQPYWMFADESIKKSVEPLIGPERTARLYEIRSFEQAGTRIVAGSDWPVSKSNPFLAIEVGMTRRDPEDPNGPVWNPAQRDLLDTLLPASPIVG